MLGKGPKKCKSVVFEHLRGGGVRRNHTPYCKVYTQRKYTLFGGKKQLEQNLQ